MRREERRGIQGRDKNRTTVQRLGSNTKIWSSNDRPRESQKQGISRCRDVIRIWGFISKIAVVL